MIAFLRKLWPFVRPYKTRLVLGLVCGITFAVMNALVLAGIRIIVDLVFPSGATGPLAVSTSKMPESVQRYIDGLKAMLPNIQHSSTTDMLLLVATIPLVMFIRAIFGYLSVYLTNWSAARAIANIRATLFDHIQNMSLSFFSHARTGDMISRITNDTQILYGIVGNSLATMVKDPVTIIAILIVLLSKQPLLTLISLIAVPACMVPITIYARRVRRSARAMQGYNAELTNLMHECFTGNRIIKAYNLEETMIGQFRDITKKYVNHMMRVVRSNELPSQLSEFMGGVGVALVLSYVVITLSGKPGLTNGPRPGDFATFVLGIVMMYQPIKSLTKLHNQLNQASAASQRIFELLNTKSTVVDPPHPVPLKAAGADIRYENVDFDYGENPVLRGINLTVKAGQLVALVGMTGSGKTTLVNLLPRFYDPRKGTIRIGQTDIREVSIKDLRQQIAVVTQETILFHDTIRKNISVGRPSATDAEIEAAARAASAHDFISERPDGYLSMVGEKGIAVSGGQRQRISIARAILKDAPILILDEATNSLDAKTERIVQAELEKLMVGRTTICIAHRLSTIQKADAIVVMSEGRIVEMGTHAELLRRGGVYQRLYELQFQTGEGAVT